VLAVSGFACGGTGEAANESAARASAAGAPADTTDCVPIETSEPNAEAQSPAFRGQTRACGITSDVEFDVDVVASGLEHPWAVEPYPAAISS
jgi:glucose/arabinose dehydrogenase